MRYLHSLGTTMLVAFSGCIVGTGCPGGQPVPESVLAGDWQTTDDEGNPAFVRFDEDGVLTGALTITAEGQIVVVAIDNASSMVEGSDVTVSFPTLLGEAVYTGTLSEDKNTITGELNRTVEVGDNVLIVIPQGEVVLTRLEDTSCILVECEEGGTCEGGVCIPADSDGDGVVDAEDGCPEDAEKTEAGICGCGTADDDTDADGVADCEDECPEDADKVEAGTCGCGTADDDTDADGVADCEDECPDDPNKSSAGACGCGVEDVDTDGDGVADCIDNCPDDINDDQADTDEDGVGDVCDAD